MCRSESVGRDYFGRFRFQIPLIIPKDIPPLDISKLPPAERLGDSGCLLDGIYGTTRIQDSTPA